MAAQRQTAQPKRKDEKPWDLYMVLQRYDGIRIQYCRHGEKDTAAAEMPSNFYCKIDLKPLQPDYMPVDASVYEQNCANCTARGEYISHDSDYGDCDNHKRQRWVCNVLFGCMENSLSFSASGEFSVKLCDARCMVKAVLLMWRPRPDGWRDVRDVGISNLCGNAVLNSHVNLKALRPIGKKCRGDFGCILEISTASGYFGIKRDRRSVLVRAGWDCRDVIRDLALLERQGCRGGPPSNIVLDVHMMVVSACLGAVFNLAEGCFLERLLHTTRFRDIWQVVLLCDEISHNVQLNSQFTAGVAIALARELGDLSVVDELWGRRRATEFMRLNIGITRFGEVSFRTCFSPPLPMTVVEQAWVQDVCRWKQGVHATAAESGKRQHGDCVMLSLY